MAAVVLPSIASVVFPMGEVTENDKVSILSRSKLMSIYQVTTAEDLREVGRACEVTAQNFSNRGDRCQHKDWSLQEMRRKYVYKGGLFYVNLK